MRRSALKAGRHLGWSADDLAGKPYARFWNPVVAPLGAAAREALMQGPIAEAFLPPLSEASRVFFGGGSTVENGFTLAGDGSMRLAVETDMPGVTPAMIDWWFGWHSDSPERYKLWHPQAHMHARWLREPPKGSRGRARYLGYTSIVDEYVGSDFVRLAISFVRPETLALRHASLAAGGGATAICADSTLAGLPLTAGYLIHLVQPTATGSVMRSRFWIGGSNIRARGIVGIPAAAIARTQLRPSENDARALLVHCAQEMHHLATFLPALYVAFKDAD